MCWKPRRYFCRSPCIAYYAIASVGIRDRADLPKAIDEIRESISWDQVAGKNDGNTICGTQKSESYVWRPFDYSEPACCVRRSSFHRGRYDFRRRRSAARLYILSEA